ncbi:MAG TPA: MMPL family transporter, partial [Solirubrobacteraceae bacterium]|nr:MMPL family transporter [Solirubrobacteraceae bacterium]
RFGDDAVIVLVRGPLTKLVLTDDLGRLLKLEGCLGGNVPAGAKPYGEPGGPCARLARDKPAKVVFGPATFVNESVRQLVAQLVKRSRAAQQQAERAARAARELGRARGWDEDRIAAAEKAAREAVGLRFTRDLLQVAVDYGIMREPRIDDPAFVSKLVFDAAKPAGTPKARFAYLFPTRHAALIQVRLKSGLSEDQRARAIADVREAVGMGEWKLRSGTFTVTGAPVVLTDLADEVTDSIKLLLLAALLIMAATLALVFRARMRLLPLAVALAAAGLTFGALSLAGASLTMASIAVLPVLIGLAVDYAIQLQSRTLEPGRDVGRAARRMAVRGAPTVATAAAATIAGFLVLVLSPVPMVRGFGLLLVVGIVLAFLVALTAGTAALVLADRRRRANGRLGDAVRGARELLAPATRGAGELLRPASRGAGRAVDAATGAVLAAGRRSPRWVLGAAAVLALAGWGLDTQTEVESDVQRLVPQDLRALKDLNALQRATGVGGQLDVVIEADDDARPEVVTWMRDYQRDLLDRYGYSKERPCGRAALCPAFSLPDLFRREPRDARQIRELLSVVPPYFSQSVITADRRTATLSFGIRLMPLERQKAVIDTMRSRLDPPEGVRAQLAGLPVLAAEANAAVASDARRLLTMLAGLLAVFAVLLVALRRWRRAAVPLVPIVLATGWSSLVLFALRIPLNPMSVTLGALVIAISTEFSVLLSERYRQEREAGHEPAAALQRTYRSTGAAVLASGATAIAGFAVLVVSDIRMLRDFGFVTVVDLTVSLLGVLVVLPSVLMLAERGARVRLPARLPRPRRARTA